MKAQDLYFKETGDKRPFIDDDQYLKPNTLILNLVQWEGRYIKWLEDRLQTIAQQSLSGSTDASPKLPPDVCTHEKQIQEYCIDRGHDYCPFCGGNFA
jgi:hypothetical protein